MELVKTMDFKRCKNLCLGQNVGLLKMYFWKCFYYFQGRAWSIQFEDSNQLDTFLQHLLNLRQNILNKNCTFFVQNKGQSEVTIQENIKIKIELENNESTDILIQPNEENWHQCLVGLKEDAKIMLLVDDPDILKDITGYFLWDWHFFILTSHNLNCQKKLGKIGA